MDYSFSSALRLLGLTILLFGSDCIASDNIETFRDVNGWQLKVNGEPYFVKGVVWGYSPRGENYSYNLWSKEEDFIKKVLEQDFSLMKEAGINAIRSFSTIPPKWVTYIFKTYGIRTAINPLMGRYGALIDGKWIPNTDYSDPRTRQALKAEVLSDVEKYRGVPGVLMFALGNESNYGLSWSSFEIEDLPVGEQNTVKAKYLYSLFGETIKEAKEIAPDLLFTIVNGDIQYIDLIKTYLSHMDLLGVNAYRGKTFTSMWKDVSEKLDLPILFFEFGSDAYNAKTGREAQVDQANLLVSQWYDMYANSYADGFGNALGGFVFQWRDEWWKYKQVENLDKHDTTASWANGGYEFDFVDGRNNMNEEWWGISRLGKIDNDGVYVTEPRVAFDALKEVWSIDPLSVDFSLSDAASVIKNIDTKKLFEKAKKRDKVNNWGIPEGPLWVKGGEHYLELIDRGVHGELPDGVNSGSGYKQMLNLDFEFQFGGYFNGQASLNTIVSTAESNFEFRYGDRALDTGTPDIELYDFSSTYYGKNFDLNLFYHVPRYHWGNEGDFFGLLRETTDLTGKNGQDVWNAKAPYGFEFVGKKDLDGIKLVAGPEIYWGANPKYIFKYQFGNNNQYTFMRAEDYEEAGAGSSSPNDVGSSLSSQTTLQGLFHLGDSTSLELGAIQSNKEKVDATYKRVVNGQIITEKIDHSDTLGIKGLIRHQFTDNINSHVSLNYSGLVADAGDPLREFGTNLPLSGAGNQKSVEAGLRIQHGNLMIFPRIFFRETLEGPIEERISPQIIGPLFVEGVGARNTRDFPFAVLGNRDARSAELFLTYDPTPGTFFYEWDNDVREDAEFAFNLGLTLTRFPTITDAPLYVNDNGNVDILGDGLASENVWLLTSRLVSQPSPKLRLVTNAVVGKQQPAKFGGDAGSDHVSSTHFWALSSNVIYNFSNIFTFDYVKNGWGPYDFHKDFNNKYPEQISLGYTKLLGKHISKDSDEFGIKFMYRSLSEDSPEFNNGLTTSMSEIQAFYVHKF